MNSISRGVRNRRTHRNKWHALVWSPTKKKEKEGRGRERERRLGNEGEG